MYKQSVHLAPDETIQLDWEDDYANFSVYVNDQLLGSFYDLADLKLGRRFYLPKGGEIRVVLAGHGPEVWHNDTDLVSGTTLLKGIKAREVDHFGQAARYLLWIGGLLTVINLVQLLGEPGEKASVFGGDGLAITSLLFIMGVWAKRTGQKIPLWIAIGLLVLDMGLNLIEGNMISGLINLVIIYFLYRGIRAGPKPKTRDYRANSPLDEGV